MTELKLIEKSKDGRLDFVIKDGSPAVVNAIRRALISEIPVMAVDFAEIKKNSSLLYDEMIAHRLGMLALTTDAKSYNFPSKCKCEGKGCASCQVKLVLKAKGPGTVYASEIKSDDSAIKPVYPKTPIVHLLKNQSLEFEAVAVLGKGREHVKWSACAAYFENIPELEIKDSKEPCRKCEKSVEDCPVPLFEYKNNKISIVKENLYKYSVSDACADLCQQHVSVKQTDDYIFHVESFGQMEPKELLIQAVKVIQEQAEEFADSFKSSVK